MTNIKILLERASQQLFAISTTPHLDAELLLCHVLKKERIYLFSHPEKTLSETEYQHWQALLAKRMLKIPVAYLIGEKAFWSLNFLVNEHTLIPRPETELLVELVLVKGDGLAVQNNNVKVLDLGTGSGAIALAVAHERSKWKITAVDFSEEALKMARINAEKNHIQSLEFVHSDWFSAIPENKVWDIIVSNPPYLDENDPHLFGEEIQHEPRSALVAKKNGLADIEKIIIEARQYLKPEGCLLFEHGCDQGIAVRTLFLQHGYHFISTSTDLAGLERVTCGVISPLKTQNLHNAQRHDRSTSTFQT